MKYANLLYYSLFCLIFLIGITFRVFDLDRRPFHGDEANQAIKFVQLLEHGEYRYDPNEHHGPSLYYFSLPLTWALGISDSASLDEATLRLTPVLFGVLAMLLFLPLSPVLGRFGVIVAVLLYATSPAMVFYSRYFIQETLLITFSLGTLVIAWRYLQQPSLIFVVCLGFALGLMHATKETCIVFFAALALAAFKMYLVSPGQHTLRELPRAIPYQHIVAASMSALSITLLLYTSFFSHPRGILDAVWAYFDYVPRAEGVGSTAFHIKPWYYYVSTLFHTQRDVGPRWSEVGILILGGLGFVLAWLPKSNEMKADKAFIYIRFISLYTLLLTMFFSVIPYKTPWNLLGFLLGFILMSGYASQFLHNTFRHFILRSILVLCVVLIAVHLGWQSYHANYRYNADPRNPYVYAHTSSAFMRFVQRVDDIQQVHPQPDTMLIRVIQPDADYWPIPWYLRGMNNVGFYTEIPDLADADMIIIDMALKDDLDAQLSNAYQIETTSLRPGVLRLVYIEQSLWERFMRERT